MKKLLYCAAALAMAFFAGSCQQENLEPVVNGSVTYTITLPETVQTKGSSGYTEGYDLYYEVYKTADFAELEKAAVLFDNFTEPITIDGTTRKVDVPFDLLNDQDYTILFWANKKGANCFELDDLRSVGIKDSASNNNDRDAFCTMDQLENVNGSITKTVTLTRPFAQLNIATEIPEVDYDVIPDYSYVKVTKVPTVYNVATGAATNEAVVEFKTAAVPVDKKITVDSKEYNLVAMNYVLVPEGNINVYYAIETANGVVTNTINNVPVKKNYRTNIVGNLLTSNATYTVDLQPGFDGGDGEAHVEVINEGVIKNINADYEVTNAAGLAYAINKLFDKGGNFYLTPAVYDLSGFAVNPPRVPADVTLNIYGETPVVTRAALNGVVIRGLDFGALIEEVAESASVSFANITLESDVPFVNENNGAVAFTDCANSNSNSNNESISGLIAEGDGYVVDMTSIKDMPSLQMALGRGVKTINLSTTIKNTEEVELDLKGATITGVDNNTKGNFYLIDNTAKLTIKNTADKAATITLEAKNNRNWNSSSVVVANNPGGNLTIESNVVIEHLGGTDMAYGIDNLTNGKGTSAVTTINGATIKSTYTSARQFLNGVEATNELIVKASSTLESTNRAIFFQDPSANPNTGKLVVEEGAELYGDVRLSVTAGSTKWPVIVSVAASALKDGEVTYQNVPEGYAVANVNGTWKVISDVAAVNGQVYSTLADAVDAVEDGGTVTLLMDVIFTEETRMSSGSDWYEGLYYVGDKSFTIDLNNHSITQNGAVNDYLFLFKNEGEKENVITFKNGTLDAGTSAYCALCTSTTSTKKITLNVENLNIIGNNSNGAVCKIRGGAEFNVKAGTVITGKNSYVGIECVNATTNIYQGAKIYQEGTGSYVGSLAGVSNNGELNVYGGEGTSAQGAFIAMTSGGTINISGGIWIANTDGTISNDNKGALIAQSAKGAKSIVNVTGGTFKGGYNCYGDAAGDAQINISGGNFNSDPTTYLVNNYKADESNGIWTVVVDPVASVGDVEYATLEEAAAAAKAGDTITVLRDATLTEEVELPANITFNGNGKQINGSIYAGGNLTFSGHTKVTSFSASYYNRIITIGEGSCLEVTGGGRVTLGYGNTFNITGSISNAKTEDKTNIQPSLIIPAGISITGGNDAAMNVTNAYVQIGSTTSKPGAASGIFSFNFVNSIVEFTKEFGFYEPTGGKNPKFNMNLSNTVMTTGAKLCIAASNSTVVADNSIIALATYLRNSGNIQLNNGSVLTGSTIQFGENGGNNGAITVDNSEFTITAGSTAHAFDGKGVGSITVKNGATATVDYYKDMTITVDDTSTFITEVQ